MNQMPYPLHFGIRTLLSALALLCVGLLAEPLHAQPSPEQMEAFKAHVKAGGQSLDSGDYRRAVSELEKARAIVDHPRIELSIAKAYEQWGRCEQAGRHYRRLLERDDVGQPMGAKVRRRLDDLDTCVQTGSLLVACTPSSATLRIDGEPQWCGQTLDLTVGEKTLVLEADGYVSETETVRVEPAETVRERIELERQPQKANGPTSWRRYAGFGALGLSTALLAGGFFSDTSALQRSEDLLAAQRSGDVEQLAQLENEARRARTRTALLYGFGVVAAGAGVTLLVLDQNASESASGASLQLRLNGIGVDAEIRW